MTDSIPTTVRDLLAATSDRLRSAGIAEPDTDAEWLLGRVMGMGPAEIKANVLTPVDDARCKRFAEYVERRLKREPVQYIVGETGFYGLTLAVDPRVLIPRPETETTVDVALEEFARVSRKRPYALDLGTGSGCIAIAIAKNMKVNGIVWAADISIGAIEVAKENADRNGVRGRLAFLIGDLLGALEGTLGFHSLDLVVSNPPYVGAEELAGLAPEVRDYEPSAALDAGTDPLHYFRQIIPGARDVLRAGGSLVLEVGAGQAPAVAALMGEHGYGDVAVRKDLLGIERVVRGRRLRQLNGATPQDA
jgi:release factor glutamine methyltransferase